MKTKDNLFNKTALQKHQNKWVAFNTNKDIIASHKSYIKLHDLIPNEQKGTTEVTFINSARFYLAPFNGGL